MEKIYGYIESQVGGETDYEELLGMLGDVYDRAKRIPDGQAIIDLFDNFDPDVD